MITNGTGVILWLFGIFSGFMMRHLWGTVLSLKEDTNPEPKPSDFSDIEDWNFAHRFWEKTRKK